MRQPYHINYKHYRGWNKIKIYSSVTNVHNGCYLLWLSSPFENWFRDPDSFHFGSGPSLIYDFQDPGDYLHEDGGREKNLGDYTWELCYEPGLGMKFITSTHISLLEFIHNVTKQAGQLHQGTCPQRKGIAFGAELSSTMTYQVSVLSSIHDSLPSQTHARLFPASFWLDGSLSGHTKGSCPKETPRSTLDSLCARF